MLRFEFEAKNLRQGDDGVLVVEIDPPRRIEGFPNDYECQIRFSGVIDKQMRGVGAFPLQAVDLALQVVKAVAASHSRDWAFHVDGQGPVLFDA